MTSALLYKEFRETLPIAAVGLACLVFVALDAMEYSPIPDLLGGRISGAIPFLSWGDSFAGNFQMTAGALALALGFWHSLGDFWGEAHLFLLHRPVARRSIYVTKLVVGLAAYLLCAVIPIVLYACWAATPGTHASPFDWSMTLPVWGAWFSAVTLYLGAFLSGLRPAAWIGTRLAPLAAAAAVLAITQTVGYLPGPLSVVLYVLLLIAAILFTAEGRDFA